MMRASWTIAGLLAAASSVPALAADSIVPGGPSARVLPADLHWSTSDRISLEQAKTRQLLDDNGSSGWGLGFQSFHSALPDREPSPDARMKVHVRQASMEGWQDLGGDTQLRLRIHAGMTSRMDRESALLVAKTKTLQAGLDATLGHEADWRLRAGWFVQGGWGGHFLQDDAMRMTNGEPAAASGVHLVFEMPVDGPALLPHALMSLEASSGSRAFAPGQPVPRQEEIALRLSTPF